METAIHTLRILHLLLLHHGGPQFKGFGNRCMSPLAARDLLYPLACTLGLAGYARNAHGGERNPL